MKRKDTVNVAQQTYTLGIPEGIRCENERIQSLIEKLKGQNTIDAQQKIIRELFSHISEENITDTAKFVCGLFAYLHMTVNPKLPIRKTLLRILTGLREDFVIGCVREKIILVLTEQAGKSFQELNDAISYLSTCFGNFPAGLKAITCEASRVVPFAVDYLIDLAVVLGEKHTESISDDHDFMVYMYNVTKFFVALLQCEGAPLLLQKHSEKLTIATYQIIMDEKMTFDIKCNTSVILIHAMNNLPKEIIQTYKFKVPCLQLLFKEEDEIQQFDISTNEMAKISVYSAMLTIVPGAILATETIHGTPIISYLYKNLIDMAKDASGRPGQIIIVSKTLTLMSKMLEFMPRVELVPMFKLGMEYIWAHLDYHLESVRHLTKNVFQNFIKLAVSHGDNGTPALIKIILIYLTDLLVNRSTHFVAFNLLAEETGIWFVLQYFNNLPLILLMNLDDPSLAPTICNTYEGLMAQHLHEEDDDDVWMSTWVELLKPLLKRSEPPATGYYQRLLCQAFELNPKVITTILHYQHLSSPNELGALLLCVRWARKNISKLICDHHQTERNEHHHHCERGRENGLTKLQSKEEKKLEEERLSKLHPKLSNVLRKEGTCNGKDKTKRHAVHSQLWRDLLEYNTLELNMCHQTDEIRIHILALVVECQRSTELFTEWELNFLKKFFFYNASCQSPNTGQQLKSLYKKVFLRIKEGDFVIQRQISTINRMTHKKPEHLAHLRELVAQEQSYCNFLDTFIEDHLKVSLLPWANHYRRALCLDILNNAKDCVPQELWHKLWKVTDVQMLYEVLDDSYESNVTLASNIIKSLPFDENETPDDIKCKITSALKKATSLNVSASLSAAYSLRISLSSPHAYKALCKLLNGKQTSDNVMNMAVQLLVQRIEKELKASKKSIVTAARSSHFYGLIYCIRHLIERQDERNKISNWESIVKKLVALCIEVCSVASPIVNNSSPEGYLPSEQVPDGEDVDETATAQMVLVFAWRTVKEVSLLLGEIAAKAPFRDPDTSKEVLQLAHLERMRDYYRTTFYETKHRGAYEQAYIGFCRLCTRLWTMPNEKTMKWPIMWLTEILDMLSGMETKKQAFRKLCATRRSAGLPFMVQAIVTTEPINRNNETFHHCMDTLLNFCENHSATPNSNETALMHSMNILRALFRHSVLSELVSSYVARGLKIAINGFASEAWGIRNSATLMFAALMTRVFGVQRNKDDEEMSLKNRMTARVFFMRYPILFDFLLKKLEEGAGEERESLCVHPILIILARLYPTNREDEQQLYHYLPLVNGCLKHSQYKTRELAAQASIPLIPRRNMLSYTVKLLLQLSDVTLSNNHCHGLVMQLTCLLKRIPNDTGRLNVPMYLEPTFWIFLSAGKFVSHITAALYLEMILLLTDTFSQDCIGHPIFPRLGELLLWHACHEHHTAFRVVVGQREFKRARMLLVFQIVNRLCEASDYIKSMFVKEFVFYSFDTDDPEVMDFVLNVMHCLHMGNPRFVRSALYSLEMIESPDSVEAVVDKMDYRTRVDTIKQLHVLIGAQLVRIFMFIIDRNRRTALKFFLVLQHFPCVLPYVRLDMDSTLTYFLDWCERGDDLTVTAALGCLGTILFYMEDSNVEMTDMGQMLKPVMRCALPSSTLHERLAVCQYVVQNRRLFCEKNDLITVMDKIRFWNIVMVLLEDADPVIRDNISVLCSKTEQTSQQVGDVGLHLIASKAREELIEMMLNALPYRDAIRLLLKWALRKEYNPIPDDDSEESANTLTEIFFDKGELNTYAEDQVLSLAAINGLRKRLWTLPDGLSYKDRSVFVEEHMFVVASDLYNALNESHEPLLSAEARITCMCILKRTLDYLEEQPIDQPNFMFLFENVLVKEIVNITFTKEKDPLKHSACDRFKFLFKRLFNIED